MLYPYRNLSSLGQKDFVAIVIGIVSCVAVVIVLGVIVYVIRHSHCQMVSRVLQRHSQRDNHLHPQSQISEVYPSSPTQEHFDQQVALLRDRNTQSSSVKQDAELGLPPQIPISKDGEEGYAESQKQIANQRHRASHQELFRPPPNRTVHDRTSPPPYYSNSASCLDAGSPNPSRLVRDLNGYPVMLRCYSMSENSDSNHSDVTMRVAVATRSHFHSRTSSSLTGHSDSGSSSRMRPCLERPREYHEAFNNNTDVYNPPPDASV